MKMIEKTPLLELERRWDCLQSLMSKAGQDGALLFQNADLLYICGTTQPDAVFVPGKGPPLVMARPPLDRVKDEVRADEVIDLPKPSEMKSVFENCIQRPLLTLGLELDVMPVLQYERLRKSFPGVEISDCSDLIGRVRSIKSNHEIGLMKEAASRLDKVFASIPDILAPKMTEMELDGRLLGLARARGHQGIIRTRAFNMELFLGHVLSGPNGLVGAKVASPTGGTGVDMGFGQGAGGREILANELLSVDICGTYTGYTVDQTRLFYTGKTPDKICDAYEALLNLVDELKTYILPGAKPGDIYKTSFALAEKLGLADGFMGRNDQRCPFIGHGIGIELDERPALAGGVETPLEAGMTFALEPRYFMPDVGVVGLEDTYFLTENGPENITITSREIREVHFSQCSVI